MASAGFSTLPVLLAALALGTFLPDLLKRGPAFRKKLNSTYDFVVGKS